MPGPDHPVAVGLGGGDADPGVDISELGALFHGPEQVVDGLDLQGFEDIAAVEHDIAGVGVVHPHLGVGVARQAAEGRVHRALAQGVVGEVVGRAQGLHEGLADVGVEVGALPEDDALGAVLLDDLLEFVGDKFEGLVPGGPPPLAGAPGAGPDHGILRPLRVVQQRQPGGALGAQGPFNAGHVRVAFNPLHVVIFHQHPDGAAHRAHEADAENFLCHSSLPVS